MELGLTGKIALVTGGSMGIGYAVAFSLASEGAKVAICARTQDRLTEAADKLASETGSEILPVQAIFGSAEYVVYLV